MTFNPLRISDTYAPPAEWLQLSTVVYGASGSGKSAFGRTLAEEAHAVSMRFVAVDVKGDWYGLKSSADGKSEGLPVVVFGGDHEDVPLDIEAGAVFGETIARIGQSCILDLEHFPKDRRLRFLADFFASLYHHNREPLLALLDEAQDYAPQTPRGQLGRDAARCLSAVEDLTKMGRKHGIGRVFFTQRGSGLNKEVSEICDVLVAFRTPGTLDQDRIKAWLGSSASKAQIAEAMGRIYGLPTGTALFASSHPSVRHFGVHAVRLPRTFDSSATPTLGARKNEPKRLATPELDELRALLASTIERAKADDPKALRARIAELERQIAARAAPTVERVEVPVLGQDKVNALADAAEMMRKAACAVIEKACEIRDTLTARGAPLQIHHGFDGIQRPRTKPLPESIQPRAALTLREKRARMHPQAAGAPPAKLPTGERAVLTAAAQHRDGVTREQLTVLTGYKRSSRDTFLQRLSASGLIQQQGDRFFATPAGMTALGSDFEPLPTGRALLEHWREKLPEGERKVLDVVANAYPNGVHRIEIDERTGYKRSSRDTYLQRLGARRLVITERDGVVALSGELVG